MIYFFRRCLQREKLLLKVVQQEILRLGRVGIRLLEPDVIFKLLPFHLEVNHGETHVDYPQMRGEIVFFGKLHGLEQEIQRFFVVFHLERAHSKPV